jgi:hypothetical protein
MQFIPLKIGLVVVHFHRPTPERIQWEKTSHSAILHSDSDSRIPVFRNKAFLRPIVWVLT